MKIVLVDRVVSLPLLAALVLSLPIQTQNGEKKTDRVVPPDRREAGSRKP